MTVVIQCSLAFVLILAGLAGQFFGLEYLAFRADPREYRRKYLVPRWLKLRYRGYSNRPRRGHRR